MDWLIKILKDFAEEEEEDCLLSVRCREQLASAIREEIKKLEISTEDKMCQECSWTESRLCEKAGCQYGWADFKDILNKALGISDEEGK